MTPDSFVRLVPRELLDRSGAVLYSGRRAFGGHSPLYVLGLNPGGDPVRQAWETVQVHTRKVLQEKPDDWSAYRDESWEKSAPGTHGMQPRVLHLLRGLGLDPGEVPASNLLFLRSSREAGLGGDLERLASLCWPFHQQVIDRLQPKVVLCFGRTAGRWVRRQLDARTPIGQFVERNQRKWQSRAFASEQRVKVVVATHPSVADWTAAETDPTPLVLEALRGS